MITNRIGVYIFAFFISLQVSCGPHATLKSGECDSNQSKATIILRETDHSTWCLNNLRGTPIATQWSDDGSTFAYAIVNSSDSSRRKQFKGASWEVPNYQWYVIEIESGNQFRLKLPEPNSFSFSPDGQYAVIHNRMTDLGAGSISDIYKIDPPSFVCKYSVYNLFYGEGNQPCTNIVLKDGTIWDVEREVNKRACEYHVGQWGKSSIYRDTCEKFYDEIRGANEQKSDG